ncbi:hypothetical protein [Lusitaniella coriacea]|uniref:hypothetical protein n=1 Tax=Lusitaniella coriacea TaxID=1983105 RepID=UPI003CE932D1
MKTHQKTDKGIVKEYFELLTKEPKTDDARFSSKATTLTQSISSLQEKIERKKELLASLEKESSLSSKIDRKKSFSEKAYFVLSELVLDIQKFRKFLSQYTNTSIDSRRGALTFLIIASVIFFRFFLFSKFLIIISIVIGAIYTGNKLTLLEKTYKNNPNEKNFGKTKKVKEEVEVLMQDVKNKEIELKTLTKFPRDRKSLDIETLEHRVKELLSEDLWYLISEAKRESKAYDLDEDIYKSSNLESLEKEPIVSLVGILSKQEIDRADTPSTNLFKAEDFYNVVGLDGKRKYSIYEFAVIFLCSDFLCGYKSYWNLLEGVEAGGQSYKFPYDRIATIKTQEKSSLDMNEWDNFSVEKSENLENTRQQILSITTKDGDKLEFMMNNNSQAVIDSLSKRYVSDPNEAVQLIRLMLREN